MLASVKLIAEPWDCGPGGYQVGGFPPGWAEWNDKFRDTVRDFWKGDEGPRRQRWPRGCCASADIFNHRGPQSPGPASISSPPMTASRSTISSSYNDKHNEANGEDNRDGSSDNQSWNCGVEGPTDDPAIIALRERQKRNMLATLLLVAGHADAARPATSSAARSRATTTPIARTTRSAGSTGPWARPRRTNSPSPNA